jgi:spore coat protein U-like protein
MKAAKNSIRFTALVTAIAAAGLVASPSAFAGGTTTLTVNAKILAVCKVIAAPATLNFNTIDPSGVANVTATTTFTTSCTNGTAETASTDNGGLHAVAGQKQMQHSTIPTAFLAYGIAYSGDTSFTGTGFGAGSTTNTVTVTGTITPAQFGNATATTGAQIYADTVTITVNP